MPHGLAATTAVALLLLALAGVLGAPRRWGATSGRRLRAVAAIALLLAALGVMAATVAAYW